MKLINVIKTSGAVGAGFAVGVFLGIAWGKTANKNKYGSPVSTSYNNGVLNVAVDTGKALKSGLPEVIRNLL